MRKWNKNGIQVSHAYFQLVHVFVLFRSGRIKVVVGLLQLCLVYAGPKAPPGEVRGGAEVICK